MIIYQLPEFSRWLAKLKDERAKARISLRIDRISLGNFGDAKFVGEGVQELRIDYGPGYRLYYIRKDAVIIVLLCGGDKRTQDADIQRAKELAKKADKDNQGEARWK